MARTPLLSAIQQIAAEIGAAEGGAAPAARRGATSCAARAPWAWPASPEGSWARRSRAPLRAAARLRASSSSEPGSPG